MDMMTFGRNLGNKIPTHGGPEDTVIAKAVHPFQGPTAVESSARRIYKTVLAAGEIKEARMVQVREKRASKKAKETSAKMIQGGRREIATLFEDLTAEEHMISAVEREFLAMTKMAKVMNAM